MFKQIYENAVAQIEANRQREIEMAKQKAMQEQVVPFNRDIDNSLRDAIAELQSQHNEKIAHLQKAFESEKISLTNAASEKKVSYAEGAINSAVSVINAEADAAIAHLRKFIGEGA